MTASYTTIGWNRVKVMYDRVMVACIALYVLAFMGAAVLLAPEGHRPSEMTLLIRALGTCAIIMLHVVLSIGPLARWSPRCAPLLYNRRHLGVCTFLVALAHAGLVLLWYHGFGVVNPLVSVLSSNPNYGSFLQFPFEAFGVVALLVLFLMAATSHDFWLQNLSARTWKTLHMLVYVAYAALVAHVILGSMQFEKSPVYVVLLSVGAAWLVTIHIATGIREVRSDASGIDPGGEWVRVGEVDEIPEARARVVCVRGGERIAVFRHGGSISAIGNVCRHQGGPLGEGKIIDGCVTCPWHGYQYLPHNGQSPPPYTEKVPTYDVRVEGRTVYVHPAAHEPGTPLEPARVRAAEDDS